MSVAASPAGRKWLKHHAASRLDSAERRLLERNAPKIWGKGYLAKN